MSKTTNTRGSDFKAKLLATASGAALMMAVCASQPAIAADSDHSVVWIELGGEFTQLGNSQEPYLPPFVLGNSRLPFITESPATTERPAATSADGMAKISLQPAGSDWTFSAAIRFGRNSKDRISDQRTAQRTPTNYNFVEYNAYQNLSAKNSESHMILDFSAGKDVGLGKFGSGGSSAVDFGVRYAQLESRNLTNIAYQPTNANIFDYYPVYRFYGTFAAARKFTGIGPSLSWDASAALAGNSQDGEITLDWGVNGAVLFGHQQVRGHHRTAKNEVYYSGTLYKVQIYQTPASINRSRQVVVPNLGGFAGLSWRYPNAKVSIGYRTDFFFNAIDGGLDTRKEEDRSFYGPFASISIGIGD